LTYKDIIHITHKYVYYPPTNQISQDNSNSSWAGHLVRMSDDRTIKKVFLGKPDGRRIAQRPKLRGVDCTENDLKSTSVKR
jgi:hypothetical protein